MFGKLFWAFYLLSMPKSYEKNTIAIAKECDINGLAQEKWENIASTISFGLYKNQPKRS